MKMIRSTLVARNMGALMLEVGRGEEFILTSHGRPIAVLGPVPDGLDTTGVQESTIGQKSATSDGA